MSEDTRVRVSEDTRPKIGDVNVLEAFVGGRGVGKSTLMISRIMDLRDACDGHAYILGHSIGPRLPERLPDGRELPIEYHKDLESLGTAARRRPEKIHVLARGDADQLLDYARKLAEANRRRAYAPLGIGWTPERRMLGKRCEVVIVFVDEGIAINAADARAGKDEQRAFREFLFGLRHEHVALFYNIQNGNARSYILIEQATRIFAFRARHRWAIEALRAGGLDDDRVATLRTLAPYHYYVISDDADNATEGGPG